MFGLTCINFVNGLRYDEHLLNVIRVVILGDFNFPNIDLDCHSAKGLDGMVFFKCQESFLLQYVEPYKREGRV